VTAAALRSVAFRLEREKEWRELEVLVARIERRGVASLTPVELARLPILHRSALSSLSVAKATSLDRNAVDYLSALAARSHAATYSGRATFRSWIAGLLKRDFPRAIRASKGPILAAAIAFLAGSIVGHVLTMSDPEAYYLFVDPALAGDRGPQATTESLRDALYGDGGGQEIPFSLFLFTHNTQVAILCFVVGLAGAFPALLLMFQNGLMLGAFSALYAQRGLSFELWAWILPHGVTELTAVVLAGGAGVLLGKAVLFPGRLQRRDALAAAGVAAGPIVVGAAAMLLVAGIFEGVFRQQVTSVSTRYLTATAFLVLWSVYFARAGRKAAEASA
jgi:uncharacterized membrane protein SpoIIM required for sporulation